MDVYLAVTERIIAELEKGKIPWLKPWSGTSQGAVSHATGKPYSLLNQMLLGSPGEYITFNQCRAEGGKVKKGERSKFVVFWKFLERDMLDENNAPILDERGEPIKRRIPMLKSYNVFHISQCEGITAKYYKEPELSSTLKPIEKAEKVFRGYLEREGVGFIQELSDNACYSPSGDYIHMPLLAQFNEEAEYYSTLFHETTHSTGNKKRLNRFDTGSFFGSVPYSKEELVAEIGACTILNELGLETATSFRNNAAYIQSWLKQLRNDKTLIVGAAGKAEKAVNLIFGR